MSEGMATQPAYQYLVNADGETTGIVISPKLFEAFEEYMIDEGIAQTYRDSKKEELISWEQVKAELVAEGKLDA